VQREVGAVARLRRRLRPQRSWLVAQDPYLIGMLMTDPARNAVGNAHPLRALWDDVRDFVTRERLGYEPTRMAEVFPADWDALYEDGLSPEQAVRLVVWNSAAGDILSERGLNMGEFHFDFEQAFLDGYTPAEAVGEALGLAIYTASDLAARRHGGES
jgi:hypothetical protein